MAQPDQRAERGEYPDHGGGGYSDDRTLPGQYDPATKKSDAGDDLRQHPGGVHSFAFEGGTKADKQRGAETDQDAGADTCGFATKLPFQPDDSAAKDGGTESEPECGGIRIERIEHGWVCPSAGLIWTALLPLALKQYGLGPEYLLVHPPEQRIVELDQLLSWHMRKDRPPLALDH